MKDHLDLTGAEPQEVSDLDLGASSVPIGSHEPPVLVCARQGHDWTGTDGDCARCGKPSSLPRVPECRHGAPIVWRPPHDCAYADLREALIPYAEAAATRDHPEPRRLNASALARATPEGRHEIEAEGERWKAAWSRSFHAHMVALAAVARGLHGGTP